MKQSPDPDVSPSTASAGQEPGGPATIDELPGAPGEPAGSPAWAATAHAAVVGVVLAVVWWAVSTTMRDGVQAGTFSVTGKSGRAGAKVTPPTPRSVVAPKPTYTGGTAPLPAAADAPAVAADSPPGGMGAFKPSFAFEDQPQVSDAVLLDPAVAMNTTGPAAIPVPDLEPTAPDWFGTPERVVVAPPGFSTVLEQADAWLAARPGDGAGQTYAPTPVGRTLRAAPDEAVVDTGVRARASSAPNDPSSAVQWLEPAAQEHDVVLTTAPVALTPPRFYLDPLPSKVPALAAQGNTPERVSIETFPTNTSEPKELTTPAVARSVQPAVSPAPRPTRFTGAFYGMPAGLSNVYLIDASGSLIDTLPFAIEELARALGTLTPQQEYAVVFFQGDTMIEAEPVGLKPATPENLARTLAWLDPARNPLRAVGRTDATVALAHAMSYDPDVLFLLSDGVTGRRDPEGDRRRIVSLVERFAGDTVFHTVQFVDPDPFAAQGKMGTLELLANLTLGEYRYVGPAQVRASVGP